MSGPHKNLMSEINLKLNELAEQKRPRIPKWVAHEICNEHKDGLSENEHKEFWEYNGYKSVRSYVTRVINDRAGDKVDRSKTQQLDLPGFDREHLQDYYVVTRNGAEIGVMVTELSDDELLEKASSYMAMSKACQAHANELMRFLKWRRYQSQKLGAA